MAVTIRNWNRNPFNVFPAEVWEIVLDEVEDAGSVFHLLSAYPQLGKMFEKKKPLWYFKGVMPLIMAKGLISSKNLRECRLVCRRWEKDVENYLENHPLVQPFNPDLGHGPEFCLQKDTFGERNDGDSKQWDFFEHLEGELTAENAASFMDEIKHLEGDKESVKMEQPLKQPSLIKGVTVIFTEEYAVDEEKEKLIWPSVLRATEAFGEYIWYFKFLGESDVVNPLEFVKLLPNLRILVMSGSASDLLQVSEQEMMPKLEKLETLCFEKMKCDPGTRNLLDTHRHQLRRLHLFSTCLEGMTIYTTNWSNLTELDIHNGRLDEQQFENCRKFLKLLDAPQLTRLDIEWTRSNFPAKLSIETDIIMRLKKFPRLLSLKVSQKSDNLQVNEEPLLKNPDDKLLCFPLISLQTHESFHLTYDFLRRLQSLQYLRLDVDRYPMVIDWSCPSPSGGIQLKREIQCGRLYESNLWEVLPKLGVICISNYYSRLYQNFDRGTYELLKAGGFLQSDGTRVRNNPVDYYYYPLRRDIVKRLKKNALSETENDDYLNLLDSPDEDEDSNGSPTAGNDSLGN